MPVERPEVQGMIDAALGPLKVLVAQLQSASRPYAGSPVGVLTSPKGTLVRDTTNGALYVAQGGTAYGGPY